MMTSRSKHYECQNLECDTLHDVKTTVKDGLKFVFLTSREENINMLLRDTVHQTSRGKSASTGLAADRLIPSVCLVSGQHSFTIAYYKEYGHDVRFAVLCCGLGIIFIPMPFIFLSLEHSKFTLVPQCYGFTKWVGKSHDSKIHDNITTIIHISFLSKLYSIYHRKEDNDNFSKWDWRPPTHKWRSIFQHRGRMMWCLFYFDQHWKCPSGSQLYSTMWCCQILRL